MENLECIFTIRKIVRGQVKPDQILGILKDIVFLKSSDINKDNLHYYLTLQGLKKIKDTINQNYRVVIR